MAEYIMERIAYNLGKDPLDVRLVNMAKEDNPVPELIQRLKTDANYDSRMTEIIEFNKQNRWRKKAMKLLPMTYGLFYLGNYSVIINIYHSDGTVVVTHSGIEMGQGINTKTAQVCAHMLGVPLDKISVKPSNSFATPNAMVTGGSIGSESVAFATVKACQKIMKKLEPIREKLKNPTWEELIKEAYNDGVDLQDTYMAVPVKEIKPYDVYGVVILELELDVLTGNHEVLRVDLLEDTGRSLSPEIDVGQIEGAFIMGLGYWTYERLIYDEVTGELLTDRTWTYKPPGIKDIPRDMRIYFRRNTKNEFGVLQSKATGEPALCLAVVVTHALREAAQAARLDVGLPDQWVHIKIWNKDKETRAISERERGRS
ncbi:Xanthine dehydrogenase [Eumeta japonica]|uniref:Xanthine dehydrogenase n=1 Tax=Eumeta variegata TaxID=151549 RepID=A0A4C1ZXN9_EUMVA|nr:Xanthine dehydrogenase [Eumeta japonica]